MPTRPPGRAAATGAAKVDAFHRERPIGDLIGDLAGQAGTLVRREIELARSEVISGLRHAGRGAGLAGLGGALIYAGFLAVLAAVVLGLIQAGMDPWLAALVVGALVMGIGFAVASIGVKEVQTTEMAPRRTVASIRRDVEYVKEQMQ
jgi:Putative Actinobacterial Holin-X, holin superfamily III